MKRTRPLSFIHVALFVAVAIGLTSGIALAAKPLKAKGAVVKTRIFNDCPTSVLTVTNDYPNSIVIDDAVLDCFGFANLHNWRLSADGTDPIDFANDSEFRIASDLVISGTGNGEAGLQVGVWYSQDVDGRLNVRVPDGEIAAFGGRLPFFSFTGAFGLHYVKGDVIHLEIIYRSNGLSAASPGTIEYKVTYNGNDYTSCQLPFDQANPTEDPPHGLWGILNEARVGGFFQPRLVGGDAGNNVRATFDNIEYDRKVTEDVKFSIHPHSIDLNNPDGLVTGKFSSKTFDGADFDVSSLRLNGTVEVDPGSPVDVHHDKVTVKFDRSELLDALADGSPVPVIATGTVGGVCFRALDDIKVKHAVVVAPALNAQLNPGTVETVRWTIPSDVVATSAAILFSADGGKTWNLQGTTANTGEYSWTVPSAATQQGRILVVQIESTEGSLVDGALAQSKPFTIASPLGVGSRGVALALRPVTPNPTRTLDVSFTLPNGGKATLAAFDVSGRLVATRDVGALGAGSHTVRLGGRSTLPAGVYLVRLTQSGVSLKTRAVVVE